MDSQRLWIKQGSYLQVFALIELQIFAYTYVLQSEYTLYSFLNVKELLAENRHNIRVLSKFVAVISFLFTCFFLC